MSSILVVKASEEEGFERRWEGFERRWEEGGGVQSQDIWGVWEWKAWIGLKDLFHP